jgi:hypothetical protein
MSKKSRRQKVTSVDPATVIDIEFRVIIKEIHTRTETICDKERRSFYFYFGDDFEAASEWLASDKACDDFGAMCSEACDQFAARRGEKR